MTDKDYQKWTHSYLWSDNEYDEDGYEFLSYISSYNKAEENYDELQPGIPHRWNIQSYFTDMPSWDPNKTEDGYSHHVFENDVQFDVNWSSGVSGENNNLTWNAYDPHEPDSNLSFSISIGPSFGPVSAGLSYVIDDNTIDVQSDHNDYLRWDLNLNSFPTDQDDTRGVYVTAESGSNYRQEEVQFTTAYGWDYYRSPHHVNSGSTVYSATHDLNQWVYPDVVQY